jgi:hypothetical protein
MPLLNEVHVAGLTARHVQKLLSERLRQFIANPHVTVSIEGEVRPHPMPPTLPPLWPFFQALAS